MRRLLSDSGYEVSDFEENLIDRVQQVVRSPREKSPIIRRLFCKPDIFAFDSEARDAYLIEVKFRVRPPAQVGLRLADLKNYLEFWHDCVLVVVVPAGFYAQRLSELESFIARGNGRLLDFDLEQQFCPIELIFPRIRAHALISYRQLIRGFPFE